MSVSRTVQMQVTDTLLRNVGGRTVLLRTPAPAVPGDPGEQLGLALPQFQDVPLSPVVLRHPRTRLAIGSQAKPIAYELLVSGAAVARVLDVLSADSASLFFAGALGILVDDLLYEIASVTTAEASGVPYLYRLTLRGAVHDVV